MQGENAHMNQLPRHNQPVIAHQRLARRFYALLPVLRQREVADARVAAGAGPFCFAVADDEAAGDHFGRAWYFVVVGQRERGMGLRVAVDYDVDGLADHGKWNYDNRLLVVCSRENTTVDYSDNT